MAGLPCGLSISDVERNSQHLLGLEPWVPQFRAILTQLVSSVSSAPLSRILFADRTFCIDHLDFFAFFPSHFCSRFWEFFSTLFSSPLTVTLLCFSFQGHLAWFLHGIRFVAPGRHGLSSLRILPHF